MTTTIVYSDATDGYIQSSNASYATMRTGSNLTVSTAANSAWWGQNNNASSYVGFQTFLGFTYTVPATEKVTAAYIMVSAASNQSTGVSRILTWVEYDWGATLTTAAWRTPAQITAITPLIANVTNAEDAGTKAMMAGSDALVTRLGSAGPLRVMGASDRFRLGTVPTADEGSAFFTSDGSGTSFDPSLVFTTVAKSRLFGVLGAQAQLSGGTHVYLEASNEAASSVLLKHHNGTSATTIATIPIGTASTDFAAGVGVQALSLVVSSADHLYVVGAQGSNPGGGLVAKAYLKGAGYTWTAQTTLAASLPSYTEGSLNNFAAAWHGTGTGTSGTIMVVAAHTAGRAPNTTGDIVYALLNCQSLLAGSGTLLRTSGPARGVVVSSEPASSYTDFANPTGAGLDVVAAPGTTDRGYVLTSRPSPLVGVNSWTAVYRYVLASGGASISNSETTDVGWGGKDASAKFRVVGIDATSFAAMTVDDDATWGLTIYVLQNTGTSSAFTTLASIRMDGQGIASFPSAASMANTLTWDAVYDPATGKLYIYYFSAADGRRLMRTSIDMSTYLPLKDETQINAAVGAAGSVNRAIRVHRGETHGAGTVISVANDQAGVHSTVYVIDAYNVAPTVPTLATRANYDATQAAVLSWTFNDPNLPNDAQRYRQLQISDASTGAIVVDSGKVTDASGSYTVAAGVLTNNKTYQWRVMTWDTAGLASPWSVYGTFSTSAGGSVTITDPVSDNPVGMASSDYLVQWSVTGTTQAAYRYRRIRTDTGAVITDTGFVASTDTSRMVTGMLSDVQYEIQITARNAALVESAPGIRRITPSYSTPDQPGVSLLPVTAGGYILVDVNNPTPTGSRPTPTANRIYRRQLENGLALEEYILVAEVVPGTEFRDYAVASGATYEYRAEAVVASGALAGSTLVTASVDLEGVWLHIPEDPGGTARNFRYGKAIRSANVDVTGSEILYAGRVFPVVDYGPQEHERVQARAQVPFGPDHAGDLAALRTLVRARRPVWFRDGRGRSFIGTLSDHEETDESFGTSVRFTMSRVNV